MPGGEQGEEDLPGEIQTHRLREAPSTKITIVINYYSTMLSQTDVAPKVISGTSEMGWISLGGGMLKAPVTSNTTTF